MFRLDNILEGWAEKYSPLQHNAVTNKTFFRIGMIDAQSWFIRHFADQPSPCMAYVTHVDAEVMKQNPKQLSYRHVVYFLIKQQNAQGKTDVQDEMAATEARFKTDDMAQDLIAFLQAVKDEANGKHLTPLEQKTLPDDLKAFIVNTAADAQYREGFRGLQLDSVHWGTLPTPISGWQLLGMSLEQIAPRRLCVNAERYLSS